MQFKRGIAGLALLLVGAPTYQQAQTKPKEVQIGTNVLSAFEWGYEMITNRADMEAGWCLYGATNDTAYVLKRTEYPVVTEASAHHIVFGCRDADDYLGRAHSHNGKYPENLPCAHSSLDKAFIFEGDEKAMVSIVVCEYTLDALVRKMPQP